MERTDAVREEALKILIKIFDDKSYSNILIKNLGQNFSSLDRAFITEMVYGTVKWKLRIDNVINSFSKIKTDKIQIPILNILRLGIYQMDFMSKVPQSAAVNESVKMAKKYGNPGAAKFVNAVLRNYSRSKDSIAYPDREKNIVRYMSVYYSFPEWIVEKLIAEFGAEFTEGFLKSSNEVPLLTVRVNKLKTDKNRIRASLAEKGIEVKDGLFMDDALVLKGVPGVENLDEYKQGYITVQDESSMLAAAVLSPKSGEFIMDVCSAPGTKTTYMAEIMNNHGKILAGDINDSKLKLVRENAERLGTDIIDTLQSDAASVMEDHRNMADRVLIDAPCSGLGIMRKKPDIRWNRSIRDIRQIKDLQESILNASSSYVKIGGVLVYSTCTVLKEENNEVVYDFIKRNRNFVLEDITDFVPEKLRKPSCKEGYIGIYPNEDGIDGFFIARMRRVD